MESNFLFCLTGTFAIVSQMMRGSRGAIVQSVSMTLNSLNYRMSQ